MRLDPPDHEYALDPDVQARLRIGFDARALERLLQAIQSAYRDEIARCFVWAVNGEQFEVRSFPDPELNRLLADVQAPFLRALDDEILNHPEMREYAGVVEEIERRRLLSNDPE